eukprot:9217930-Prorocentrum_lima.AAC.1
MTSSLVGSEMCIRDRCCRKLESFHRLSEPGREGEELDPSQDCSWDRFKSVSYTHLTLPTICSV